MPLAGLPGWVSAAMAVVLVRKLTAVHALPMAVFGVCAPAKRSRSMTWARPERSTTATATW